MKNESDKDKKVVVRFPPSPTGFLQLGNIRTLIYNYLFARHFGGTFLLRIEDTDKERSTKEYEEAIYNDLKWLGLDYDNKGDVWRSSERTEIYKDKIQELIKKGAAYISEETEGENKQVVRFKNPGGKIKFHDLIRGDIEIDVTDLNDFIIARNVEDPLYHLAVSIDDTASGVTHIIRGDDHISNTPRQILLIEALGGTRPVYAHLPLVLASDKSKLSKRKHGETVSLRYYEERGYQPEAMVNFLSLLGWNPGDTEQEIFSMEELIDKFDISKVQKKGAVFDVEKLNWMNKQYIFMQSKESQVASVKSEIQKTKFKDSAKLNDSDFVDKLLKIILERIHRWGEVEEVIEAGEYDYLFEDPVLELEKIAWKKSTIEQAKINLEKIIPILGSEVEIMKLAEEIGKGDVLWPLRYSLSGREKSPDPFTLLDILGIEESKTRVRNAINEIK